MVRLGAGKFIGRNRTLRLSAHRASPVSAVASLVAAAISPTVHSSISVVFLPLTDIRWPIRSEPPVRVLIRVVLVLTEPDMTLKKDSLPTNGSAMVLKT